MSKLALKLIAENKKTRATFLDLGNCGLTEVPDEIGELVWLEGLSFASDWKDGGKWVGSQNTAAANNIAKLSPAFFWFKQSSGGLKQLTRLKKLWLNGDYGEGKKFRLSDLSPLANLSGLQGLNVANTPVTDLSPLANLSGLQWLNVFNTPVTDLSPLANLSSLQQLNVANTPVTDLSPLANLSGLQELNVANTPVTDLSPLANLSGLQQLNVANTPVTDLSPLANLSGLQQLNVYNTPVTDLSPLANLSGLQQLNVANTPVTDLSPLANLSGLQQLNVYNTPVTDLSPLANLSGLQQLNVSNTPVTDLSPLANLSGLQGLSVASTSVTDLSPLANLSSLQQLNVANTPVTDLSPLANLSGLQGLNVSNTPVTDLSPLANLSGLQQLNVYNTPVTDLSPLANLSGLQRLDVHNTRVTELSPLLELIENNIPVKWASWDEGICVEDCPLINPPVAIVKQGNEAILNYFHEKQSQGSDHLYEAKLLLVGEGGAGKTSLLRRLYQPEQALPAENETTKGIAIHRHEFNVIDNRYPNGRNFRLNVWDFGGQEIYHATHQFFLTQRSLYILLDDTRKDDKTVHDEVFKYWLDAVDLLSSHSPVLIFQNEKGGRSKAIDLAGIKGKFDNVIGCYPGNLEQADAADKLRDAIEFFAKQLPHIGEELPKQWLSIRAEIEQLAEQQATITLQEYFELYQKHLPFDRSKALLLSRYLHDLGVFLHFQDDDLLRRTVILQNQWATEAVFKMLDDEQVKAQLGRFSAADCQRLWQDSVYADMHPELLALMQKFELCYLLPDTLPKHWLAPQLLPPSKPAELNAWATAGDLVLRYRYEFLPKGMINRLMVRLHRFVPRPELGWLTGVLFERDGTKVLVEIPAKGGEIMLRAKGLERKELLSVIAADLDALNETFKGLPEKVSKLVPCNCGVCIQQTEPKFFEHKDLLRRKKVGKTTIECPASFDNVNVLKLLDGIQVTEMPDWSIEQTMKKIFISYSKHDIHYKDTLLKQLSGLRDRIVTWNDRDILPGEEWDKSIKEELCKADIVLYLVSSDSMATDYIQQVELPLILQRCDVGECKLVPIIVRACDWEEQGFAKYNALPMKGKHIKSWDDQDEAWLEVVKGIKKIIA